MTPTLDKLAAGPLCKRCQVRHRKPENCPYYGKDEPGGAGPEEPPAAIARALADTFGERAEAIGQVIAPELAMGVGREDLGAFLEDEAGLDPMQAEKAIQLLEARGVIRPGPLGYQMAPSAPAQAAPAPPAAPAPAPVAPPAPPVPPPSGGPAFRGALAAPPEAVAKVLAEHGPALDQVIGKMQGTLKAYERAALKPRPGSFSGPSDLALAWKTKSPGEKLLHAAGHEIGAYFESTLSPEEKAVHERYMQGWQASSKSTESQHLHGLAASLGVPGSPTPQEAQDPAVLAERAGGLQDPVLAAYVAKAYTFTQAALQKLGVRELTGYRGVSGMIDGVPPATGDPVNCKTREMSSFSTDPTKARIFGRRIEYKIPASQVFASSLTRPGFGSSREHGSIGEAEIVVLGSSTSTGKVTSGPLS